MKDLYVASFLKDISTRNLVNELRKRDGVESIIAEPYADKTISTNGPAIILIVTD